MYKYSEPMYERIRRIRLLRKKYLKDESCAEDQFAKLLGIKPSLLKRIENSEDIPSAEILAKISKILKVSIEHLLDNRVMAEDEFAEPITFVPQIGSVIHAERIRNISNARKGDWRKYSLKSVAGKLDMTSMELKRIEDLNKSTKLSDARFLKKLSSIYGLPHTYIKDLTESSFPRGDKKKDAVAACSEAVHYVRDGDKVKGLVVVSDSFSQRDLDVLKKRIEFEVELLRSKPAK